METNQKLEHFEKLAKEGLTKFLKPGVEFDDLFPEGKPWPKSRDVLHTIDVSGKIHASYRAYMRAIELGMIDEAIDAARIAHELASHCIHIKET